VGLFAPDRRQVLAGAGAVEPELPMPTHLFASQIGSQGASKRPRETLVPLADRLGLPVDSRFAKDDIAPLAAALRAVAGVALVAWEHHRIPLIVAALGCSGVDVPAIWPDDRYDVVWVLERPAEGMAYAFRQLAENLLAGDRVDGIAVGSPV
jgi:hypothetical protein